MPQRTYCYDYPKRDLTVDCVLFGLDESGLKVLLVRRDEEPYKNEWALPGGFLREDETLEEAARRVLEREAGVREVYLEQLYTFGDRRRNDPRGMVVTVAYFALVSLASHPAEAHEHAAEARWTSLNAVPNLAFDHARILQTARERLRAKVRYQPIGFELLDEEFTLADIHHLYEVILGRDLDLSNFRKKIMGTRLIEPTGDVRRGAGRPATLYRFSQERYEFLAKHGMNFEIVVQD